MKRGTKPRRVRYFTTAIDKYLASWILPDTWDTFQDIDDRFWRFVISIHYFSKPIQCGEVALDDPSLATYPNHLKRKFSKEYGRNPRTYNKKDFIKKILLSIEKNHPNFDKQYANKLITELADKAMLILDALYYAKVKLKRFSDIEIQRWDPPLK